MAENGFYREFEEKITLSEAANLLPNMKGTGGRIGVLKDLREAAELYTPLAEHLKALANAGIIDRADYMSAIELIVLNG